MVRKHTIKEHGLECARCDFFTKSKSEFQEHKKTHPIFMEPKNCKIEGCEFKGEISALKQHQKEWKKLISFSKVYVIFDCNF